MSSAIVIAALVVVVLLLSPGPPTARLDLLTEPTTTSPAVHPRLTRLKDRLPGARKAERARSKRRAIEVATGIAAAVEAGLAPRSALADVVVDLAANARSDGQLLATVVLAATNGGDVAHVLMTDERPHWRAIGVAWRVGEESGAAFAPILDRVAETLRTEEKIAREAAMALATARSTARLLAVLPGIGILMGKGIGGDPIAFLLGGVPGLVCLTLGITLEILGLLWTRRLLARAGGA